MTDESLSSKIKTWDAEWEEQNRALDIRDVREAVKKLKDEFKELKEVELLYSLELSDLKQFEKKIDEIFGKELCE